MENENKMYVIRTYCYGKRPHESYLVTMADGSMAITEEPTLEALLAAMGSEGYVPQEDIPHVISALAAVSGKESFGEEEDLSFAKEMLTRAIIAYDASTAVNSFSLNGVSQWLSVDERMRASNIIKIAKEQGQDPATISFNGITLTIGCDIALQKLAELEMYALACLNVTAAHKKAVAELESVEELSEYNYTVGYPSKLKMEV